MGLFPAAGSFLYTNINVYWPPGKSAKNTFVNFSNLEI